MTLGISGTLKVADYEFGGGGVQKQIDILGFITNLVNL